MCAGRSSCLLTVITVQLSSGLRVTLMLATVVVVVLGFWVSVLPGRWLMRSLVSVVNLSKKGQVGQ